MDTLGNTLEPLRALWLQAGILLPRLGLALLVAAGGWLLAKALRFATVKALRAVNLQVLTRRAGLDAFLQQGGTRLDTTDLVGLIVQAAVLLGAAIVAFNGLGLMQVGELLGRALLFLPRLLIALAVLVVGLYFARFVGQSVAAWCRAQGIGEGALAGRGAQAAVVVFVLLITIDQLQIGGSLVQQTFLILLGGVVLALALAFGIGARHHAQALLERWFPRQRRGPDRH